MALEFLCRPRILVLFVSCYRLDALVIHVLSDGVTVIINLVKASPYCCFQETKWLSSTVPLRLESHSLGRVEILKFFTPLPLIYVELQA